MPHEWKMENGVKRQFYLSFQPIQSFFQFSIYPYFRRHHSLGTYRHPAEGLWDLEERHKDLSERFWDLAERLRDFGVSRKILGSCETISGSHGKILKENLFMIPGFPRSCCRPGLKSECLSCCNGCSVKFNGETEITDRFTALTEYSNDKKCLGKHEMFFLFIC